MIFNLFFLFDIYYLILKKIYIENIFIIIKYNIKNYKIIFFLDNIFRKFINIFFIFLFYIMKLIFRKNKIIYNLEYFFYFRNILI